MLSGVPAFAAEGDQITVTGFRVDADGDAISKTHVMTTGKYRELDLSLNGFFRDSSSTSSKALVQLGVATSATPYLYSTGYLPYIIYPINSTITTTNLGRVGTRRTGKNASPIVQTFRVPDDYLGTSAAFIITCQNEPTVASIITPCYLDWDITIFNDGDEMAGTAPTRYGQQPIVIGNTSKSALTTASLIEQITLTYATPSGISAGDMITLRLWPTYTSGGSSAYSATQAVRIYGASFKYLAQW